MIIALIAVSIALIAYANHRNAARRAQLKRLVQQDKITVKSIVSETETIRAKLGRAPMDQTELESLLGKPLPVVHDHGYPTPIHYMRTAEDSFMLQYELWGTDDWIYDSTKPSAGWVQHWY